MSERRGIAAWLLHALEGTDAAAGDVVEELEWRRGEGRAPRFPRAWVAARLWMAVMAALALVVARTLRTMRFVVRDAFRALRSTPGATAFALVILTVGIGAATVTFSVVDHVVIRSLPFEDDERLVVVSSGGPNGNGPVSPPEFFAWHERVTAFESLAAVGTNAILEIPGDGSEALSALGASASLFDVLGVQPLLGRAFTEDNEVAGRDAVVVISHGVWQRAFGGDPGVVGRTVRQTPRDETRDRTIVAVMPPGFTYPYGTAFDREAWVPLVVPAEHRDFRRGRSSYLQVIGKLRDDATLDDAITQLSAVSTSTLSGLSFIDPAEYPPSAVPLKAHLVGGAGGWMLLVLWAVVLVMLVACVNVANLMLARSQSRAHELSVRAALGASRGLLGVSLLVESLSLSAAAVTLGVVAANWGLGAIVAALPGGIARVDEIAIDLRVLGFAAGAAVATGLFFGLAPARQASRTPLAESLKDAARAATAHRRRWRTVLMSSQVALVALLLVVSALFVSSFVRVTTADLGFERRDLVTFMLRGMAGRTAEALEAIRATPGVASAAHLSGGSVPLVARAYGEGGWSGTSFRAADTEEGTPMVNVNMWRVSPELFETAGIEIVRGRSFAAGDEFGQVVILDEQAAASIFGEGTDPVGRSVYGGSRPATLTVVGVARPVRIDGPEQPVPAHVYFPEVAGSGVPSFLVRTSRPAADVVPMLQSTVAELLPAGTPPPEIRPLDEAFRILTAGRRFNASLMSAFGLVALFIGAAGVYAVMSSLVMQQRRELGVRVALGATRRQIIAGVLRGAAVYLGVGLVIGLIAGRLLSELFASLLFEVRPGDAYVYAIVAAILATVGLLAALGPARRASRVDPLVTLRAE